MSAIAVVYIAGPYSDANPLEIERNVRRAEHLAYEVEALGAAAVCPHTNTRFPDSRTPYEQKVRTTLEVMRRCDAVIFTSDWERSSGARDEHAEALRRGMPIFVDTAPTAHGLRLLKVWMDERATEKP